MRMPLLPVALYGASHIWYREPAAGPDVRMVRPFEGAIKPPITTSGIFRGTVASGRARDSVHNSEPELAGAARQPGETAVGQGISACSAAGWTGGHPAPGRIGGTTRRIRVGESVEDSGV